MKLYLKIYKHCYGSIPVDEEGRAYEIHHIDGDRNNNHPANLYACSIQEHYNIHKKQGDVGACFRMAKRMKLTPKEISELSQKSQRERIKDRTHHFVDNEWQRKYAKERVKKGTHNFIGVTNQRTIHTCPKCGKTGKGPGMYNHFAACRSK